MLEVNRLKMYPYTFAASCLMLILAYLKCPEPFFKENLLTLVGMTGAFFAFLYTQHLQSTQFLKQLFNEFNARYDQLNDDLAIIFNKADSLTVEEINTLVDYFNLCAEEYFYFHSGYIDEKVWESWRKGMQFYLSNQNIYKFWSEELKHDSYYGLTMKQIEKN